MMMRHAARKIGIPKKHYDANECIADKRIAPTKWQDSVLRIVGERPVSPEAAESKVEVPEARDDHTVSLHRSRIAA